MLLSSRIVFLFVWFLCVIILVNIVAFFLIYSFYFHRYLQEKSQIKKEVTLEYIDSIIEKQTIDEFDSVVSRIEARFFELLEKYQGKIPLDSKENRDIVLQYLQKAGVSFEYLTEFLPQDHIQALLHNIRKKGSPEYNFFVHVLYAIVWVNGILFVLIVGILMILMKNIFLPIKKVTKAIENFQKEYSFQSLEYSKNDEVGCFVKAINELHEKLHIEEEIRHKLLADISHELKTPITSIRCYLEGIKDGVFSLNKDILWRILAEMDRLIVLVNMIMEYEKYDASTLELHTTEENVPLLIEFVVMQYIHELQKHHQKVCMCVEKEEMILLDRDRFIQIVQNILSNFIKYAWENTTLFIFVFKEKIIFKDNGKGIAKEEVPYVKEKFYQGKNQKVWDVSERWIGVGLSIVDKIVKAFWWKMEIISDEGKGFEVVLYLNRKTVVWRE